MSDQTDQSLVPIEELKPEQIINIEGPAQESLFRRLLTWLLSSHGTTEFQAGLQKELDAYWAHYKDLADERAVVLVGSLCVEDCLDRMINAFFPASKVLHENRDFTFSLKIDILRACKFIPSRILDHCDLIRKLRNDFAHNLGLKTLSDRGKKFQSVVQAIESYQPSYATNVSPRKRFEELVALVCVALRAYTTHVESMRTFLDSQSFMESLKAFQEKG